MPSRDQHLPDVERRDDLRIPVGDETVSGTRYRPEGADEPLPAVLMAIPYRKDDRIVFGSYYPSVAYVAAHGYEVLAVDLLGTGASSGRKPEPRQDEGEEIAAVIEWVADRPWCDGAVGMFGKSYGALTQLETAAAQPDALEAIVPVEGTDSVYQSQYMYGAFKPRAMGKWYPQMQAWAALPPSYRDDDGRWADVWRERLAELRDRRPWLFQALDHPTKDDYWQRKDVDVDRISVPTLAVGGYRDMLTEGLVQWFERLDAPKRLLIGPWRHTMPHRGTETALDFRARIVEWFDHHLKGEDNGAMDGPTVTYWTEREGGWSDAGHWRGADRWPIHGTNTNDAGDGNGVTDANDGTGTTDGTGATDSTDATETLEFALTPEGVERRAAFTEGRVAADYEFDPTVGIHSMEKETNVDGGHPDATPDDLRSLTFETEPLESPVELTGTGTATVRLRSTTPDPVVAVRVTDVLPDGTSRPVTSGHLKASHRNGHESPEPLELGEPYELTVPLRPKSQVFERGHRIRVAVSASLFPRVMPDREQGSFTVLSDPDAPSLLSLPGTVHEGDPTFEEIGPMAPPDDGQIPTSSPYVVDSGGDVRYTRQRSDAGGDTGRYETFDGFTLDLPHGAEVTAANHVRAEVDADDPSTATVEHEVELSLDYGHETYEVEGNGRVGHDTAHVSTTARVDGQVVFDEVWTWDPRRGGGR